MKKKLIAVITAAVLLLANSSIAFADVEANKNKLQELEEKVYQLENDIFIINDDITSVKEELKDNIKEIELIEQELTTTEEKINEFEEDLKDKQAIYDLKMRQFYKENGQFSYLSLLFESKSLGDLIARASLVSQLLRFDNQIINDFHETKNNLLQLVAELNNKAAEAERLKNDTEERLLSLEEKRNTQRELVEEINTNMEVLIALIAEEESYIASQETIEKNEVIIDSSVSSGSTEENKNEVFPSQNDTSNNNNSNNVQPVPDDTSENSNGGQPPQVGISPEESNDNVDGSSTSLGVFKLTGYCNCEKCCGSHSGGTTATGTKPKAKHTIAVDPSLIPYGTVVIINGEDYVAEDCGGGVTKYHIDIYFDTHEEALAFGAQYAEVFIKE